MTASMWLAVISLAAAAGLLRRTGAAAVGRVGVGGFDVKDRRRAPTVSMVAAVAAAAGVLAVTGSLRVVAAALVGVALVAGTVRLLRARRREVSATTRRSRVIELCDAVQAELAAGQGAGQALERAAVEWAEVAPVARVAGSGGDVPGALRELAAEPGAGALRVVAAAWQVAHRTGHGLADTLGRVADDLRAGEQTRRIVAGELASARATARLLAVLPVLALVMGSGAGGDPWQFLLGHPVGLACLTGGLGLTYGGLVWIDALARSIERDA